MAVRRYSKRYLTISTNGQRNAAVHTQLLRTFNADTYIRVRCNMHEKCNLIYFIQPVLLTYVCDFLRSGDFASDVEIGLTININLRYLIVSI